MTTSEALFDGEELLRILVKHNVRFIVIGGFAAQVMGSPLLTRDLDICYARDRKNLEGLADSLREVTAVLRGAPADLRFRLDALTLGRGDSFMFATRLGWFDILATPSGTEGYDDLLANAQSVDFFGIRFLVASIDDLIRMKRAAGRVKDRVHLEDLGALRDQLDKIDRERS